VLLTTGTPHTTDAERIARSTTNNKRAQALTAVAAALAAAGHTTDAERIARSITDYYRQVWSVPAFVDSRLSRQFVNVSES